jgi:hypothetical protein
LCVDGGSTTYYDYPSNKDFIERINEAGLITPDDYKNIIGADIMTIPDWSPFAKGYNIGRAENMKTVLEILRRNYQEKCGNPKAVLSLSDDFITLKVGPTVCEAIKYELLFDWSLIYKNGIIDSEGKDFENIFATSFIPKNPYRGEYIASISCYDPINKKSIGSIFKSNTLVYSPPDKEIAVSSVDKIVEVAFFKLTGSIEYKYNSQKRRWEYDSLTGWAEVKDISWVKNNFQVQLAEQLSPKDKESGYAYLEGLKSNKLFVFKNSVGSKPRYYGYNPITLKWNYYETSWKEVSEQDYSSSFTQISKQLYNKNKEQGYAYLESLKSNPPSGLSVESSGENFVTVTITN